jgi:hypothetical protein
VSNTPEQDVPVIKDATLGICRQCARGCSKCTGAMQCVQCEADKWLINVSYPIAPAAEYHDGQCLESCPENLAEDSKLNKQINHILYLSSNSESNPNKWQCVETKSPCADGQYYVVKTQVGEMKREDN